MVQIFARRRLGDCKQHLTRLCFGRKMLDFRSCLHLPLCSRGVTRSGCPRTGYSKPSKIILHGVRGVSYFLPSARSSRTDKAQSHGFVIPSRSRKTWRKRRWIFHGTGIRRQRSTQPLGPGLEVAPQSAQRRETALEILTHGRNFPNLYQG